MAVKPFFTSEFGYCPLAWMLRSKKLYSPISKFQERMTPRIIYQDYTSSFIELNVTDNSTT